MKLLKDSYHLIALLLMFHATTFAKSLSEEIINQEKLFNTNLNSSDNIIQIDQINNKNSYNNNNNNSPTHDLQNLISKNKFMLSSEKFNKQNEKSEDDTFVDQLSIIADNSNVNTTNPKEIYLAINKTLNSSTLKNYFPKNAIEKLENMNIAFHNKISSDDINLQDFERIFNNNETISSQVVSNANAEVKHKDYQLNIYNNFLITNSTITQMLDSFIGSRKTLPQSTYINYTYNFLCSL